MPGNTTGKRSPAAGAIAALSAGVLAWADAPVPEPRHEGVPGLRRDAPPQPCADAGVEDAEARAVVAPAAALGLSRPLIEEGQAAVLTVAIAGGAAAPADRTIALTVSGTASAADYTLEPSRLALPAASTVATATLTVVNDRAAEQSETVVIAASLAGEVLGSVTATIQPSDAGTLAGGRMNPVGRIRRSGVTVALENFVRAPQSVDPTHVPPTNDAYARVQYLVPVPGGDRLAFNDLRGVVYLTDREGAPPAAYLDLSEWDVGFFNDRYPNEMGLMGLAFHPEFAQVGWPGYGRFYTAHTATEASGVADYLDDIGSHESVVREWTAADPLAPAFSGTSREVLRVGQPRPTLDIGTLAFNRAAAVGSAGHGLLYIALGDGGGIHDPDRHGQNLATPLGAVLRIDPLGGAGRGYEVPADNPFASVPGAAPEIWAYGLRHPQHFSFDSSGRMFINDIGEHCVEEVNIGRPGANYGWPLREGTFATAFGVGARDVGPVYARPAGEHGFEYPVAQYDHDNEGRAIGSGFLYEGDELPALRGRYVFADVVAGRLFAIEAAGVEAGELRQVEELRLVVSGRERRLVDAFGIVDAARPGHSGARRVDLRLGLDHDGELYVLTKSDGWIRRLVPGGLLASVHAVSEAVVEGSLAVFAVSLNRAPSVPVTVSLTVAQTGSVLSGPAPRSVTVDAGETMAALRVPTHDDDADEADGSLTVTLKGGTSYGLSLRPVAGTRVRDDDAPTLARLSLSGVDFGSFSGAVTRYAATVPAAVAATTVTAVAAREGASVRIAGGDDATGGATRTVPLAEGPNTVTTTVTVAGEPARTYTVTVTRRSQR